MWSPCWLAATYEYTDASGRVHVIPYGHPPLGTPLAVPCDFADFLFGCFTAILSLFGAQVIAKEVGLRHSGVDWERLAIVAGLSILLAAALLALTWVPFRYLRNAHRTPPGVHTPLTGPEWPSGLTYAWSSIGHWPRLGWISVVSTGALVFGWVTRTAGAAAMHNHRALFDVIDASAFVFGFVLAAFWFGRAFLPWYSGNPRIQLLRDWWKTEIGEYAWWGGASQALNRQLVIPGRAATKRLPDGTVVEEHPLSIGEGLTQTAAVVRDSTVGVFVRAGFARSNARLFADIMWVGIPIMVTIAVACLGGVLGIATIGGCTAALLLGITGGAHAVAVGFGAAILVSVVTFGVTYAYRWVWRAVWEIGRWLILRPKGPYPVSV